MEQVRMPGKVDYFVEGRIRKIKLLLTRVLPESLLFELKKLHYVRSLKSFSEKDVAVVKLLVKPGDYVIDIGPHVGWYTRILSELVGEHGRAYSLEPVPQTFDILSTCVRKLRLKNVELINCAISDHNGSGSMEVPLFEGGGENFYQAHIVLNSERSASLRRFNVTLRTIDTLFCAAASQISFIKCDVVTHEYSVIKGAKRLITISKPVWLIEMSGDPDLQDSDSFMLFNYLTKEGYSAYWFDGQALNKRSVGHRPVNYFFLTLRHIGLLKDCGMLILE